MEPRWWPLLCAIILVQINGNCYCCLQGEKTAQLDIKQSVKLHLNDPTDTFLPSWASGSNTTSSCCDWERVTCDSASDHVFHLSLDGIGPCPDFMTVNLSLFLPFRELRSLNLSSNCFDRWLLTQDYTNKSTLKMLQTLDLSSNAFDKSIMGPVGALPSLKNLLIANNLISGPFPIKELSVLLNLEQLDLSDNFFHSPSAKQDSSASFSSLKNLRTVNLAWNSLDKKIFNSVVALPNLRSLFLEVNGDLEVGEGLDVGVLANLSNLELLILRDFFPNGSPLPIQGLCKMKKLQELYLSFNDFTGSLEACFENLTSLRALDLSGNQLSGNIPSSFFDRLTSLEYLSLSHNQFEGLFSLGSLANNSKLKVLIVGEINSTSFQVKTENPSFIPLFQLEFLEMPNCQLNFPTRNIPTFLSYQHDLRYIDLSYNNLVGTFPAWLLVKNPKLEGMFLNDNSFNGTFQLHSDLNNQGAHQLHILDISQNKIRGELPKNIGSFLNMEYLNVSSNLFDGDIPASIGDMPNLNSLDLAHNNFSGKIPKQLLLGCISLELLRLSNNSLEGQILPKPLNLRSLRILLMGNNHFNGSLQEGLLSLNLLGVLDVSNNKLSGELPGWIGKMQLALLNVAQNNLEGTIPKELCKLELILINLSHNRFIGSIPSCLGTLWLRFIHLQENSLSGTIPEVFLKSTELVSIDLRNNKISGSISKSIKRLESLKFLSLGGNELQGELPIEICHLKNLNFLDLSHNNFSGSIPICFNDMAFGAEPESGSYDDIDFDYLSIARLGFVSGKLLSVNYQYLHFDVPQYGSQPDYYVQEEVQFTTESVALSYKGSILNDMSGIDLSCNQLTGEIPGQIGDLHNLHALNLSHNHFNGSIPERFHKLQAIESLDLSYNNLVGDIPFQLQELNSLAIFNVSYNNLSGRVPYQGQFGSFDESSYKGNPYLYFNNSNRGIATLQPMPTSIPDKKEKESAIDFTYFCWSFAASYVVVSLMLVIILWINPQWRRTWFYLVEICLYKCFGRFLPNALY